MILYITEKPSAAEALANVLGATDKRDGYYACRDGSRITFCLGHLLKSVPVDHYEVNAGLENKAWDLADLPIIPSQWENKPRKDTRKQLACIGKLLDDPSLHEVVQAADPDREGQRIIDDVLDYFHNQKRVVRLWTSALDPRSIERALCEMKPNSEYKGWADAAVARSRADWLIGINLTRAYTLTKGESGNGKPYYVGRVQTPLLALVVRRDEAIEDFEPMYYYKVNCSVTYGNDNYGFAVSWVPMIGATDVDEKGRMLNRDTAETLASRCENRKGEVHAYDRELKTQLHPLAFTLSGLMRVASSEEGYSAEMTLELCQSLYEKHKLISYARTDCGYLPEFQHEDAPSVLECIGKNVEEVAHLVRGANSDIVSDTWDDTKLNSAHHGIIPTAVECDVSKLSKSERIIYTYVVKRYISQFYDAHKYWHTKMTVVLDKELFTAESKEVQQNGWKGVLSSGAGSSKVVLPELGVGDVVMFVEGVVADKRTLCPNHYTEGTLIRAMETIRKTISDPEEKQTLYDSDGLGTSGTRAGIISELKRRDFLMDDGKYTVSTHLGRKAISLYSDEIKSASLTAINERLLSQIQQGAPLFDEFAKRQAEFVTAQVRSLIGEHSCADNIPSSVALQKVVSTAVSAVAIDQDPVCVDCRSKLLRRASTKVDGAWWWGCTGYPACSRTFQDKDGSPLLADS